MQFEIILILNNNKNLVYKINIYFVYGTNTRICVHHSLHNYDEFEREKNKRLNIK